MPIFTESYVLAPAVALAAGVITTLFAIPIAKVAVQLGAVDAHGQPRVGPRVTPRLGGVAIFLGISMGILGGILVIGFRNADLPGLRHTLAVVVATGLVFCLGVVDDIFGSSVIQKFTVQTLAAGLVVAVGLDIEGLRLPFAGGVETGAWGGILAVVWIVGVTNAINLIDGMDGLASGVVAIIASSFLLLSLIQGRLIAIIVSAAVVGACIGFLRCNWQPARVFMGDSGSLPLGFLLATLSIHSMMKSFAAGAILIPLLALGLPVADTVFVMSARFLNRPHSRFGERIMGMFHRDRSHIHHLLEEIDERRHRIVVSIYVLAFVFCTFSVLIAVTRNQRLGIAFLIAEIGIVLLIRVYTSRKRRESAQALKTAPDPVMPSAGDSLETFSPESTG